MASNYFMLTLPELGNEKFLSEYLAAPVSFVETPPLPSDDEINPNMTLGEMMDKKISPPGMIPTWSESARKKYEACISPHIDAYKLAVDKINRGAQKDYNLQTYAYVSGSLGVGSVTELFGAFRGDQAIRARWSWTNSPTKAGLGINRGAFWVSFIVLSVGYIYIRRQTLKAEYDDFVAQTNFFFKKLTECRQNNPYDMWRVITPQEEYFEKLVFTPSGIIHPNQNLVDSLLNPDKKKKMFWLPQ
jgi:hypothetical protein